MTAFVPLRWPASWPRAETRFESNFDGDRTITAAAKVLRHEVEHITGYVRGSCVITCGTGSATPRRGDEVGAAVYFTASAGPVVLAVDKWDYCAHNVWALAMHVKGMRALERYGVGTAKMAWDGFGALPPSEHADPNASHGVVCPKCSIGTPSANGGVCPFCGWNTTPPRERPATKGWRAVLGFTSYARPSFAEVDVAYKKLAMEHHPDVGGDAEMMKKINAARDEALDSLTHSMGDR